MTTTASELEELGARVRRWRQHRDLLQSDLAARAGVAQGSVSAYEVGRREMSVSVLRRIAEALGVDAGVLLAKDPPARRAKR